MENKIKISAAAEEYVNEFWKDAGQPGDDIMGYMMAEPFEAGAKYSNEHQWHYTHIEVPDDLVEVIGRYFQKPGKSKFYQDMLVYKNGKHWCTDFRGLSFDMMPPEAWAYKPDSTLLVNPELP